MTPHIKQWSSMMQDTVRLQSYEQRARKLDAALGCFLSFNPNHPGVKTDTAAPLAGIPIAVKDNIAVKDRAMTCGSKILENFIAPYSATAVTKLETSGGRIVGKTNLDEFGMGSSNEHSALQVTVNPWNKDKVPGGSSGGSAAAVASGLVPLALGSDTGGSIRQPANFCGTYGLKPTYGTISRFGLTAYASSLEVIGLLTRDIDLLKEAFRIVSGMDENDQSSVQSQKPSPMKKKVAIFNIDTGLLEDAVQESCNATAKCLTEQGYQLSHVDLPSLKYVVPAYYTIATAEASANLARYNGMRYGSSTSLAQNPLELMTNSRSKGFGDEVKLRIMLGTFVLRSGFQDQYYGRAQKVRTLIRRELAALYKEYDLLLMPVYPTQAFARGDSGMDDYQQRIADIYTSLANLAGLPAISVPTGIANGLPTGVQFMASSFEEEKLFQVAGDLVIPFPLRQPDTFLDIGSL